MTVRINDAGSKVVSTLILALSLAFAARAAAEETPAPPPPPGTPVAMTTPPVEQPTVAATAPPAAPAVAPAPPPPPYSLPWQLRPVAAANVIRSDTAVAFYDNPMGSGSTVATMLLGSYKVTPSFAPMVRMGFVQNGPPGTAPDGTSFVNPVVGGTYAFKLGTDFRLAAFLGVTIPVGMGGGSTPDPAASGATSAGIAARSGMDNAMFAVNYTTVFPGVGFAYVAHKLTLQAEATVFQLFRVKGSDTTGISPDSTRTNSTMGIHAGYFVLPMLSLGGEMRYQRWLSTPSRIVMGVRSDIPSANMDTVSFAVGPRFHFKMGSTWLRPGISYAQVLDQPFSTSNYKIVQIDVPFVF
jgi:hypothetical protein